MTLILSVQATDGIVFGSDSQVTAGPVRYTSEKIFELNKHALWAGSGEVAVIQRMEEQLLALPESGRPLAALRDTLSNAVSTIVRQMLQNDFRTGFLPPDPEALLTMHRADFLFAEICEGKPRVLHLLPNGTTEWIRGPFAATGNGDLFAHALLKKFESTPLTLLPAKVLAYKTIEEAIEVGAYGLGPPIRLWTITPNGASRIGPEELAAIDDAARVLRENEVLKLAALPDDPFPPPPDFAQIP